MNYRINYLDNAKAFGMILVFQGHLIEQYMWNGVDSFNFQMSLIYSFHMPFFFFLSGFFFKENSNHNLLIRLKTLFFKRITPVVFFNIVGIIFFIISSLLFKKNIFFGKIFFDFIYLLGGHPRFNHITWFLICLFSTECINIIQQKYLGRKSIFYSIPSFAVIGYLVSLYPWVGFKFWYIGSSFTAIVFYQTGILFSQFKLDNLLKMSRWRLFSYLFPLIIIWVIFTKINIPYLAEFKNYFVLISGPKLGNFFYFYISAFAGSLGLIIISKIIPTNKLITHMGRNTIILLGIAGIFFHYINRLLIFKLPNIYILFISTWLITFISFISCYPLINPLNRILKILTNKLETFTSQDA